MANIFGQAYDKLGDSRSRAAFVAVTVDPERDTVDRVRQYLVEQHLRGKMSFLTGSRPDLEAVWSAHHVAVAKGAPESGGSYDIAHSVLVYVIDAQGRERTLIKGSDFTAGQLVGEMRPLLSESGQGG